VVKNNVDRVLIRTMKTDRVLAGEDQDKLDI
jgi:hypothetical protein